MAVTSYAPIASPLPGPAPLLAASWQGNDLYVPQSATALPAFCVKCGQRAAVRKTKTYYWHEPWVYFMILAGLVVYAVVALIVRKRIKLEVPLCSDHARTLSQRKMIAAALLLGFLPVGIAGSMMGDAYIRWAWLIATIMLIAGSVYVSIAVKCFLKPTHIDDAYASFKGPGDAFLRQLPMRG